MRSERGFSLVELLFALLILTIVILTTLAVFTERTRRLRMASDTILAWQALSNEVEAERHTNFADVTSHPAFLTNPPPILASVGAYSTKVDVASPQAGIKTVTMTVLWDGGRREAHLSIVRVDTGGGNLW